MSGAPSLPEPGDSNLAFALFFLPRKRHRDAMLFYRFCRAVDDIADDESLPPAERERRLDEWNLTIEERRHDEIERLIESHSIERNLLLEILRGCASDIHPRRFQTIVDLEDYCWKVAAVPGLVSLKIFGCRNPQSETYAIHLGQAMQLTNILRDVGEDAGQGRIYLPLEDLARFRVSEQEILEARPGLGFRSLMTFEAGRAATRYAAAIPPREDWKALLPARAMARIYRRILRKLEHERFPVFQRKVSLGRLEKAACIAAAVAERIEG
jgi:phytoene synthase